LLLQATEGTKASCTDLAYPTSEEVHRAKMDCESEACRPTSRRRSTCSSRCNRRSAVSATSASAALQHGTTSEQPHCTGSRHQARCTHLEVPLLDLQSHTLHPQACHDHDPLHDNGKGALAARASVPGAWWCAGMRRLGVALRSSTSRSSEEAAHARPAGKWRTRPPLRAIKRRCFTPHHRMNLYT
jgi:hypothetical protein